MKVQIGCKSRSRFFASLFISLVTLTSLAQTQIAGSSWQHVQQLAAHSRVHISADKESRTCSIQKVDDDSLTCSAGRISAGSLHTFSRQEIKSIKITRYRVLTAAGLGLGAGVGLIAGAAVAHDGGCDFFNSTMQFGALLPGEEPSSAACAVQPSECADTNILNTLDGFNIQPRI